MKSANLLFLLGALAVDAWAAEPLTDWTLTPADWKGAVVTDGAATLSGEKWSSLRSPKEFRDAQLSATVTIAEPAKHLGFFGQGWSAWPDATFSDGGFDAGFVLRAGTNSGYRVQLSHRYQVVAVVKWPEGGCVRGDAQHAAHAVRERAGRAVERARGWRGQGDLARHVSAADERRGRHRGERRGEGDVQRSHRGTSTVD